MNQPTDLVQRFVRAAVLLLACAAAAQAADEGCLECHAQVVAKAVVHGATNEGCTKCHTDAKRGVSHERGSPPLRRLQDSPQLCVSCHEPNLFEGKLVHAPIGEGKCLGCHDPHASDNAGLLKVRPAALCLDCHPNVRTGPHVIAAFSQRGHPLGDSDTQADDPLRPGKPFYCAGCHEPHRSEFRSLLRWDPAQMACQKCHKM